MLKKAFLKTFSLLYKAHHKAFITINNYFQEEKPKKSSIAPYILKQNKSTSTVKVIHVNGNFIVGGTTQLIVDIIENMSGDYIHEVIVPDCPEPLPYQPVTIHKYSIYQMQELYSFLEKERPAIVHIHYWVRQDTLYVQTAIWYHTIFKICEELKIGVIQNINVPTKPHVSKAVVHNVYVSDFVLRNFDAGAVNSSVIHPGSNFHHFSNKDVDSLPENSIGMVYRLDKDKLNSDSIEVFITVVKKRPNVQCYIVGGGYFLDYYKRRVTEENISSNFYFTGFVSYEDLPSYYRKMSVFVAPVHDESFGQVTPFAMSMGLCVAGYNTGALSEILGSEETLVDYGQINQLADTIIGLLSDSDRRKKTALNNQVRAHELFSVEKMIENYKNIYNEYVV